MSACMYIPYHQRSADREARPLIQPRHYLRHQRTSSYICDSIPFFTILRPAHRRSI